MWYTKRNCNFCKKEYMADNRNLKRGWGLACGKSCSAKLRERNKPGYNPVTVAKNNYKREHWNDREDIDNEGDFPEEWDGHK